MCLCSVTQIGKRATPYIPNEGQKEIILISKKPLYTKVKRTYLWILILTIIPVYHSDTNCDILYPRKKGFTNMVKGKDVHHILSRSTRYKTNSEPYKSEKCKSL